MERTKNTENHVRILVLACLLACISITYAFTGDFSLYPNVDAGINSTTTTDFNVDTNGTNSDTILTNLGYVQRVFIETSTGTTGTLSITEYATIAPGDLAFRVNISQSLADTLTGITYYLSGPNSPNLTINQTLNGKTDVFSATSLASSDPYAFLDYFTSIYSASTPDVTYANQTIGSSIDETGTVVISNAIISGTVHVTGNLTLINTTVTGNVKVTDGNLVVENSTIEGNINTDYCNVIIINSIVDGQNIQIKGNPDSTYVIVGSYVRGNTRADAGTLILSNNTIGGTISGSHADMNLWQVVASNIQPDPTTLFVQITQNETAPGQITVTVDVTNIGNTTASHPSVTLRNIPADWNVSAITIDLGDINAGDTAPTQFTIQKGPTDADVYVTAIADNAPEATSNIVRVPIFWTTILTMILVMTLIYYFTRRKAEKHES